MEGFSFAEYFAEINTLADLQFLPGEKPYIDSPAAGRPIKRTCCYTSVVMC
jgi:hypothetical protein